MNHIRRMIQFLLALGFLLAGGALAFWLVQSKPLPPVRNTFSRVREVAVISVGPTVERTPIAGYGTIRAKNQINIIPQVSGMLVYANKNLAQGKIIPEGELLFEIDRTIYEARAKQVEAEVRGLEAEFARLEQGVVSLDERIANAEEMLAIEKRSHLTSKHLYEVDHVGTPQDLDRAFQKYLRQKDILVDLKSRQAMAPYLRAETQAKLDAARAKLEQARHDLNNTKITCPFKARVESVGAYSSQVVTAHFSIATLTDMEAFEISVGIDPRNLRWLDRSIRLGALERNSPSPQPGVKVRWSLPGQEFSWVGRVTRFEQVDEATRTARLIVEIRDVDMAAKVEKGVGSGPMLSIGMYCRADLPAEPLTHALLVPRHAIYENHWVYVFEPDSQSLHCRTGLLGRRRVPMLRSLGQSVLVSYEGAEGGPVCELRPGDRVIVSPLTRPVVGMKIAVRQTTQTADWGNQVLANPVAALASFAPGTPWAGSRPVHDLDTLTFFDGLNRSSIGAGRRPLHFPLRQ